MERDSGWGRGPSWPRKHDHQRRDEMTWTRTTRKPLLLLRLFGWLLLRAAARRLSVLLLLKDAPRSTRWLVSRVPDVLDTPV